MITLVKDTISNSEIDNLVDWLKTYPRLTKGPRTLEFEQKWSDWIGTKNSLFCNSGSSANLLMLQALLENNRISRGSKVVVPSVAWATDLAPVMQLGLEPILCDADLNNLSVDLEHLENLFLLHDPDVLILVSVLGLSPDMDAVMDLCDRHDVILLEDVCESLGTTYKDQKLGTFGLMSSFSTFFGHHLSTIEGGIVCTDDSELSEVLKSIRSHGWDRDLNMDTRFQLQQDWDISEFNSLYTFYYSGFNLRSTDLQAFLGINQLDGADEVCIKRESNFQHYQKQLKNSYWKVKPLEDTFTSNFAYPVIHPERELIVQALQDQDVEVRPMICGSMGTQPFYMKTYEQLILKNVTEIDMYGFYLPNHPELTHEEITSVCNIVNEYTK
jgi:CDP-6-deoxy-D-xylo-4-hexulose-3-dehydrase